MSQSFNTASVTSTNSEKLFISTDSTDADNLELQSLKALIRDNIIDNTSNASLSIGDVSGTGTDLAYDFHTVNMINQDIFSSQIHIIHTTYVQSAEDASFIDVSCGLVDLSQIEIDETTAAFVEGTLILDICNGADDISLNDGNGNYKHNLQFTSATDDDKTFTKAFLSTTDNSDTSLLFSVIEDASNTAAILLNKAPDVNVTVDGDTTVGANIIDISNKLDVFLDNSNATALSALPSDVTFGDYNITYSTDGQITTTIGGNSLQNLDIKDLSGNDLISNYTDDNNLEYFLPHGSNDVPNYQLDISLNVGGNISIGNESFDISGFDNMVNNFDYMNAIRDYGNNKNILGDASATILAHTDVSSHNILITNSTVDLSFGGVNDISHGNGGTGSFITFLNNTQDEYLSSILQGEIKLFTRAAGTRVQVENNDDVSNVVLSSTVAYIGDTAIQSTYVDLCLNETETVTYTVKQKFPNPGSSLLNSLCVSGGNQTNALAIKDASSTLFSDTSINAVFDNDGIATLQDANPNNITFIKVTDNNKFATRVNKVFDLCNTDLSYGNPDIQIEITGTNVQLDIEGAYNYDVVRLFLEPKTLADISNAGTGLVADAGSFLDFSTTDAADQLKTKVDYSNKLNDFVWDVIDNGTSLDMSFSIVPNIVGDISAHEFQSKIQTLIKREWSADGTTVKEVVDYPADYTLTVISTTTDISAVGVSHEGGTVKQHTHTTTNSITDPFPLSAYQNIQTVMSNITITDVYFEWYHSDGTKGPESKLRTYTGTASRTITYTPQSRTITKSMIHTMRGQLQGRTKGTVDYNTSEPKYDIDLGFNLSTTIDGFNSVNNSDARFVINMDLDQGDVALNSVQYSVLLDFAEGNTVWNTTKKTGTLLDMTNGIGSLQDIFDATGYTEDGSLNSIHTVHIVDDNTGQNTLTLRNGDVSFATLDAISTLLANFVIVVANGPVFDVLRNGDDISFDQYKYTDNSTLLIDNGIQLDICENLVNFGGSDISLTLLKDQVSVNHVGLAGSAADITTTKTYTDSSAQDVSFNNYRGIIANQTIELRRVGGTYQLDFSGISQTINGDLLDGTSLDASMSNFGDVIMGDIGYDIISNKSHLGTTNLVASTPLTLTPAQYKITGTVATESSDDATDRTSFSDILFEHFQNDTSLNLKTAGFFKTSRIAATGDPDRYKISSSSGNKISVNAPNNNFIVDMPGVLADGVSYFDLSFNSKAFPFIIRLRDTIVSEVDVYFSLSVPKYQVQYRNPTGVDHFPFLNDANTNTSTEYVSTAVASHILSDISATLSIDTSKTYIDFALNRSSTDFTLDLCGNSNTLRARIVYNDNINPGIDNEYLVIPNSGTDTSSVAISIDQISKTGNFYQLSMTQKVNGLYTTDGYDVCSNLINSSANIIVKLPSAYMNTGSYQSVITPNIGVKTSLIGAEYDLSGSVPVIKIRKYTSPTHESFETFKIDQNQIRAVGFRANLIEEAIVELTTVSFGSTAYSFQDILNSTATALSAIPTYTTILKNDISGESIWDDYATNRLNYVMVPLTYSGIGNILEVTGASSIKPVKTLVASTPDITRITSADGAPVFRVRANGRVDTGTIQASNIVSVTSQTNNSEQIYNNEFISYNVLLG